MPSALWTLYEPIAKTWARYQAHRRRPSSKPQKSKPAHWEASRSSKQTWTGNQDFLKLMEISLHQLPLRKPRPWKDIEIQSRVLLPDHRYFWRSIPRCQFAMRTKLGDDRTTSFLNDVKKWWLYKMSARHDFIKPVVDSVVMTQIFLSKAWDTRCVSLPASERFKHVPGFVTAPAKSWFYCFNLISRFKF